jgi:AcrR family transcriptional regulator
VTRARGRPPAGGRDTRAAIVATARTLFAELGFERTTMRAVAAGAGVDVALIYHHFSSKHGLLTAALAIPAGAGPLLAGIPAGTPEPGRALARLVLTTWEHDPALRAQALATTRAGLSDEQAAERARDLHRQIVLALVDDVIADDHREMRAGLIGALLLGLVLERYQLQVRSLADADLADLIEAIAPALDHYLTGDLGNVRHGDRGRRQGDQLPDLA